MAIEGYDTVWVFTGNHHSFPSGVFATEAEARAWIASHRLSGTLTEYPIGVGVWDWAVANGHFRPKRAFHETSRFIANFTAGAQRHYHFEEGE